MDGRKVALVLFLLLAGSLGAFSMAADTNDFITIVDKPDLSIKNDYYISNRQPLEPAVFIKLPVGSIKPKGWLLTYLQRQRDGLTGQLGNISAWLQKEDNAWLSKEGKGKWGWEELPYWLKGYGNIGYLLNDPEMIKETKIWIEAVLNSQRPDGDFGPDQRFGDGSRDYWATMIMLFCLQSYYEYSSDERVLDLMTKYFKYQMTVPDERMLTGYWQRMRGGDNLYSIFWLYNRTGDTFLLDIAEKIHRNTANWKMQDTLPNWHNVNIAQAFGEPATYYLLSKDPTDSQAAYDNFRIVRDLYGQVPGGMFGGDENCRPGYDDPRQGVETCGMVEQMLSDELLFSITGDIFWADHCEEIAFNTYPAAVMPDFKSLRYITSPNMVLSDQKNHSPGIQNAGPFLMMNPFSCRCCQHNHSHGWPYFTEHLWMATPDNGVCAALYSESNVNVKVGDGTKVNIEEDTRYPFEQQIRFRIKTPESVSFPLYLRIPKWCSKASLKINDSTAVVNSGSGGFIRIQRKWRDGDKVTFDLPMKISTRTWIKNHNSLSVDYGPLTFSLKIGEKYIKFDSAETAIGDSKWQKGVDKNNWPSYEIHPATAWNYGLVLDENNSENSFILKAKPWPDDNFPFTLDSVPLEMQAKAKKIPQWTLDRYGLCAPLQDSPVKSNEATETVSLVPMGAARLRISAFPVIGKGTNANQWKEELKLLPYNPSASHCFGNDDVQALCDQLLPENSSDHSIPRMTFWDHKGTIEWVQYNFEEPKKISAVEVYWFDDTGQGQCRVPERWRLMYDDGGQWKHLRTNTAYSTKKNQFNKIRFQSIITSSLRLEVELQKDFSAGILEWKIVE